MAALHDPTDYTPPALTGRVVLRRAATDPRAFRLVEACCRDFGSHFLRVLMGDPAVAVVPAWESGEERGARVDELRVVWALRAWPVDPCNWPTQALIAHYSYTWVARCPWCFAGLPTGVVGAGERPFPEPERSLLFGSGMVPVVPAPRGIPPPLASSDDKPVPEAGLEQLAVFRRQRGEARERERERMRAIFPSTMYD